jgi:hypothetical protein
VGKLRDIKDLDLCIRARLQACQLALELSGFSRGLVNCAASNDLPNSG